jgi:hypothetical protein
MECTDCGVIDTMPVDRDNEPEWQARQAAARAHLDEHLTGKILSTNPADHPDPAMREGYEAAVIAEMETAGQPPHVQAEAAYRAAIERLRPGLTYSIISSPNDDGGTSLMIIEYEPPEQ